MSGYHYGFHDWPLTGEDCPVCAMHAEAHGEQKAIVAAEKAHYTETLARSEHEVGYVLLTRYDDSEMRFYSVQYRDGGILGSEPYNSEADARAAYERRVRSVGGMA